MPVAVVQVGIVRVRMPQGLVPMPMRVRLRHRLNMVVLVMLVMDVDVFMLEWLVRMLMIVPFGEMQI